MEQFLGSISGVGGQAFPARPGGGCWCASLPFPLFSLVFPAGLDDSSLGSEELRLRE